MVTGASKMLGGQQQWIERPAYLILVAHSVHIHMLDWNIGARVPVNEVDKT